MFVLTVDQRRSRSTGDRIDELLTTLDAGVSHRGVVRAFERTAGDEVQGMTDDPDTAVHIVLSLIRDGNWSVGIGVGAVDTPIPDSVRAASGPAFVAARDAVVRAKSHPRRVAVSAEDSVRAADAEALLALLAAIVQRRSRLGWEVVDLMTEGLTQQAAASRVGITPQAVSQRLQAALWHEEHAVRPLAGRVLKAAYR